MVRIQIQLGLWIRIQNLDPSRKANITQKKKNKPEKELPNELKASLGYLRLLLDPGTLYGGLKRKYCNLNFKNLNFMSTLILHFLVIENLGLDPDSPKGLDPDPSSINTAPNH